MLFLLWGRAVGSDSFLFRWGTVGACESNSGGPLVEMLQRGYIPSSKSDTSLSCVVSIDVCVENVHSTAIFNYDDSLPSNSIILRFNDLPLWSSVTGSILLIGRSSLMWRDIMVTRTNRWPLLRVITFFSDLDLEVHLLCKAFTSIASHFVSFMLLTRCRIFNTSNFKFICLGGGHLSFFGVTLLRYTTP